MTINKSRRAFLAGLSASGAASLFGSRVAVAEEAPLETTAVRFASSPGVCVAPHMGRREAVARRWLHRRQLCGNAARPYRDGPNGARRHGFHCRLRDLVRHFDR